MAEGKTYNIPAARFEWFKTKMEGLSKKAKKLTGEKSFFTAVGFHNEENKESPFFGQRIMEVFVAVPEPKLAGWEFVARIDHANEAGNIIRTTGMRPLPVQYRHTDPICDHCGHNRRRRDTFVIFNEQDGFRQVGSSCLADFLGHKDVAHYARLAELIATIRSYARGSYETEGLVDNRYISVEGYLDYVAEEILQYGFISRKMEREYGKVSTADAAFTAYLRHGAVSDNAKKLARDALEWALALDEAPGELNDYLHNCWVVANAPGLEQRSLGIAASIVGVYAREQKPVQQGGQFMGIVGERLELLVRVNEVRTLENDFGTSYLHRMVDGFGNVYTWFATKPLLRDKINQVVRIKGRVKKHDTFKGRKSTVLTRVTVQ